MRNAATTILVTSLLLGGCSKQSTPTRPNSMVIAIPGGVNTFSPLFAESLFEGEINDLLFPGLVGSAFDTLRGTLTYTPLLAKSWEFSTSKKDITFHLQPNARWSDGTPVTARDVQLSYELYGDPEVASVRQAAVEQLRKTNGSLVIAQSVEVLNDSTVTFHFERVYPGQIFDAGLPIMPAHVLGRIPRKELRSHAASTHPLSAGPFRLARWTPMQEVVLESNPTSVLPFPAKLSQLVFRMTPEYATRIAQLETGEVDFVAGIRADDADRIAHEASGIQLHSSAGRDYDFIGWNNIDQEVFASSKGKTLRPHSLFGSARVRRALTLAINRDEIIRAYLGSYGRPAVGGVSPIFTWAYNDSLQPLPFAPEEATRLLAAEGWRDTDGDGTIDKAGRPFRFTLKLASGIQLRSTIATVIQQQLARVGVGVTIEQVESGTFWGDLMERKYDAWYAGFSVPLQLQLEEMWGADLVKFPFNLTGFQNPRVTQIFHTLAGLPRESDGATLWKEFQAIVHEEQPCTFLYWTDSIIGVHGRVKGLEPSVIGITHGSWNWTTE